MATTILWINGAHGVGKTTVARAILRLRPAAFLFDPERVGHALRKISPHPKPADFKAIPGWAEMVVHDLRALLREHAPPLVVVPMTVIDAGQLQSLLDGLREGADVRHVTLTASEAARGARLRWRIDWPRSRRWAREHGAHAARLLADPAFAPHVPTDGRKPGDIAAALLAMGGT